MKYISSEEVSKLVFDDSFPRVPSEEVARKALYDVEAWGANGEDAIMTYEDIEAAFADWDQSEEEEKYESAYDWFIDCLWNGFHPIKEVR